MKYEIGEISKHILDQINLKLGTKLSVNEWENAISELSGSKILITKD